VDPTRSLSGREDLSETCLLDIAVGSRLLRRSPSTPARLDAGHHWEGHGLLVRVTVDVAGLQIRACTRVEKGWGIVGS